MAVDGFNIPNEADASYASQAELDSVDIDILVAGFQGWGIKTGLGVTAQGTPDMTVNVASGTLFAAYAEVASAGNAALAISAADASLPRFDLIVVDNAGTVSVVAGTAASRPVFPAVPASSVALASVYVPAAATSIATASIYDRRNLVGIKSLTGVDGAFTVGTRLNVTSYARIGSASAPANTTAGDLTAVRLFINDDSNFAAYISASNPLLVFDANDWVQYSRTNNYWQFFTGSAERLRLGSSQAGFSGYLRVGSVSAPANTTAGDITGVRYFVNDDSNFSLQFATSDPEIIFDSSDALLYTRSGNAYQFYIGGSSGTALKMQLDSSSDLKLNPNGAAADTSFIQFSGGRAEVGYNGTDGTVYLKGASGKSFKLFVNGNATDTIKAIQTNGIYFLNDQLGTTDKFGFTFGSTTLPILSFDANDYIRYDRTANTFDHVIGSTVEMQLTTTLLDLKGVNMQIEAGHRIDYVDNSSGVSVFRVFQTGDTQPRFNMRGEGGGSALSLRWGAGGASATDVTVYRSAAGVLRFDTTSLMIDGYIRANPPATQTIAAATDTLLAASLLNKCSNTTAGSITLTSTPTIADGVDGQMAYIRNVGTQNVVLQDQGTLALSNLRLEATTVTIGPRQTIHLQYDSTVGDWVQVGKVAAVI